MTWDTEDVEREVFERLNKAHFDVVPVGGWGFLGELLDPDWFYPQALVRPLIARGRQSTKLNSNHTL